MTSYSEINGTAKKKKKIEATFAIMISPETEAEIDSF